MVGAAGMVATVGEAVKAIISKALQHREAAIRFAQSSTMRLIAIHLLRHSICKNLPGSPNAALERLAHAT
jgi:hypothetical protein